MVLLALVAITSAEAKRRETPEEKAERYQLMQQYGCTELEAAFKVAENIDQARGIESPALELS